MVAGLRRSLARPVMPVLWSRLKALVTRRRHERDLQEELAAHLRLDAEERIQSGVPPDEARRDARRELGSVLRVAEDTRAVWSWTATSPSTR